MKTNLVYKCIFRILYCTFLLIIIKKCNQINNILNSIKKNSNNKLNILIKGNNYILNKHTNKYIDPIKLHNNLITNTQNIIESNTNIKHNNLLKLVSSKHLLNFAPRFKSVNSSVNLFLNKNKGVNYQVKLNKDTKSQNNNISNNKNNANNENNSTTIRVINNNIGNFYDEEINTNINPHSRLSYAKKYDIDKYNNQEVEAYQYLDSDKVLLHDDIVDIELDERYSFSSNECKIDRLRFIEKINLIRYKHRVNSLLYDKQLENQAKATAYLMQNNYSCKYIMQSNGHLSELFYYSNRHLTEEDVLEEWYKNIHLINFDNKQKIDDGFDLYPVMNLIWDKTKSFGCSKVCCLSYELTICNFYPVLMLPDFLKANEHIHPNRFLNNKN